MDASQRKSRNAPPPRRRSSGGGKWLFLLIIAAAAVLYYQRSRIVPWLEQDPRTAPILQSLQVHLRPADEKAGPPLTSLREGATATGGETTFSSGQGFGTVTPDDGSDAFRVVVPPDGGSN